MAITIAIKKKQPVTPKTKYILPTKPVEPVHDLGAYSWLIYGPKKIGKSTLASLFEKAIFFMFEPGAKALRIHRVDCNTWGDGEGYLTTLEDSPDHGGFKTVVIDTGFEFYQKALRHVCAIENIEYPRNDNFGKDWDKIKVLCRNFHDKIFAMNMGFVVLCHESLREQQTFTGAKYDQVVPLLPKGLDEYYRAVIDNIAWYHYRGKDRFLQIRGTDAAMAGLALQADEFFKTPKGEPIHAIPIPADPKGGMKRIQMAFENKQLQTFKEETEKFVEQVVRQSITKKVLKGKRKNNK